MLLDAITRGRLYQVKFLLESGSVNVNITDQNGQTPMMKAILLDDKMQNTRYKIVRLLLEHGAEVNLTDKDGRNALMLAVIHGQKDVTEKILKCSVIDIDLNAEDYDGNTALIYAARGGYDGIVSLLITSLKRFGLDVDKKNRRGLTAMLEAVRCGQDRCAQVLMVEGDASLTIRDPENFMNAEEWAFENQLLDFLALIKESKQQTASSTPIQNSSPKSMGIANGSSETKDLVNLADGRDTSPTPEPPRNAIKRPPSRKLQNRACLTVPKIQTQNFVKINQDGCEPVEANSKIPTELSKDRPQTGMATSSVSENEAKGSKNLSPRSDSSIILTKRRYHKPRLSAGSWSRCSSANTEVGRLFELYGVQSSAIYRKGYDPTSLPPSGMWPDPTASISSSVENLTSFDRESDYFGDPSFRLTSRRSVLSEASTRRSSVFGNTNNGRRMSILAQGRKFPAGQAQPRLALDTFARRPGDRRMSMATRQTLDKPVLRKMNSTMNFQVA